MAARGRLWGAERIRGELLKLGIKVSKRTIQKYMRGVRGKNGGGQSWATFVKNHAERTSACDFIQTHDLLFRQVYAFFIVHLASRRGPHREPRRPAALLGRAIRPTLRHRRTARRAAEFIRNAGSLYVAGLTSINITLLGTAAC